jgi:hypothetical protein
MRSATLEREQSRGQYAPQERSSFLVRRPVLSGLGFAALALVVVVGVLLLPDIIRYMKIRNM